MEQALDSHRDLEDVAATATAYDQTLLALALTTLRDVRRAGHLLDESLTATDSVGETWLRSLALWAVGIEACRRSDQERATAAERQSIRSRLPLDSLLIDLNFDVLAWKATAERDCVTLRGQAEVPWRGMGTSTAA